MKVVGGGGREGAREGGGIFAFLSCPFFFLFLYVTVCLRSTGRSMLRPSVVDREDQYQLPPPLPSLLNRALLVLPPTALSISLRNAWLFARPFFDRPTDLRTDRPTDRTIPKNEQQPTPPSPNLGLVSHTETSPTAGVRTEGEGSFHRAPALPAASVAAVNMAAAVEVGGGGGAASPAASATTVTAAAAAPFGDVAGAGAGAGVSTTASRSSSSSLEGITAGLAGLAVTTPAAAPAAAAGSPAVSSAVAQAGASQTVLTPSAGAAMGGDTANTNTTATTTPTMTTTPPDGRRSTSGVNSDNNSGKSDGTALLPAPMARPSAPAVAVAAGGGGPGAGGGVVTPRRSTGGGDGGRGTNIGHNGADGESCWKRITVCGLALFFLCEKHASNDTIGGAPTCF